MGLFVHFGVRTFDPGYEKWDSEPMDLSLFNPRRLDCERWVRTAKEAGMRYAVLTAKHHDGYCNWPSEYTDYSVAHTPWKNGEGDVVGEFAAACHRHGLKLGLYYSPADVACPDYDDPTAYDDYFVHQMSELVDGRYGEVSVLWFDGCGTQGHTYDWERICGEARHLQPNLCIFHLGDPDIRWVGTEAGIAPSSCWNVAECVETPEGWIRARQPSDGEDMESAGNRWMPAECDCMMREHGWFYQDAKKHAVKSLEQLLGIYYYSVGRGCNMLLNIAPDTRGLFPEEEELRLREFGAEIQRRFALPLKEWADFTEVDGGWEWTGEDWRKTLLIDHVVVQEDLTGGESVGRFRIDVWPEITSYPITVHRGTTIGDKAICRFPAISVHKVRIEIEEARGPVKMRNAELHLAGMP